MTMIPCPKCKVPFDPSASSRFVINGKALLIPSCKHMLYESELFTAESITSYDGKKLMPFQCIGERFIESASGRALVADEMGLGKTVQALSYVKLNPDKCPVLFVVKSALKVQWQHEIMRWCGEEWIAQIIEDAKTFVLPGLKAYIVSFDLLRRLSGSNHKNKVKLEDDGEVTKQRSKIDKKHALCERLGIKTIIIDECQQIKNVESQRTYEVKALCYGIEHVIALSGTPIKNNASEYFPILNILRPDLFPSYARFVYHECDTYFNGFANKTAGLRYPDAFMRKTKDFIIRRTREEVMPELPQITRNPLFSDLAKEVEKQYLATLKEFQDDYDSGKIGTFQGEASVIAYLSKMRHITGLSKIQSCFDFIDEFLLMTERKLVIFVHHQDVGQILKMRCEQANFRVLNLTSSLDSDARAKMVEEFKDPSGPRIMIASTLAAGEGLNLQFCSDCVMMERQWNPANEEQAEGRFIRIGQLSDKVTATYLVAVGTIDEFFAELVERKREIVSQTLNGEAVQWDQSSLIKELAETLAKSGGRKWGF